MCQSEIRMCENWNTDNHSAMMSEREWEKTRIHQFIYNFFLSVHVVVAMKKKKTKKMRIINMKNDKLFCSSGLINGKMWWRTEKSANDAVISILVAWIKIKRKCRRFFLRCFEMHFRGVDAIWSVWALRIPLAKSLMNEFGVVIARERETERPREGERGRTKWIVTHSSSFSRPDN